MTFNTDTHLFADGESETLNISIAFTRLALSRGLKLGGVNSPYPPTRPFVAVSVFDVQPFTSLRKNADKVAHNDIDSGFSL